MSIKAYNELDWNNPNPYDVSYYYYLNEMLFERTFKNKLNLQLFLLADGSTPDYFFGGDFTQMLISSNFMHCFFNACKWILYFQYKQDVVFNSSNFDYNFMIVKKHLKYADRDILTLLNIDDFYMAKFQTYNDKVFFIKSCYKMLKACRYTPITINSDTFEFFTVSGSANYTSKYQSWEDCKTAFSSSTKSTMAGLEMSVESSWYNDFGTEYEVFRMTGTNRFYVKTTYPIFRPNQAVKMFFVPCNASNYSELYKNLYIDNVQEINSYNFVADSQGYLTADISFNLDDFYPIYRATAGDKTTKLNYWRYYPLFIVDNYNFYQYK